MPKLKMTLQLEPGLHDYALFLDRWVIRRYKDMPSREELKAQEVVVEQVIRAYDEAMWECRHNSIELQWIL